MKSNNPNPSTVVYDPCSPWLCSHIIVEFGKMRGSPELGWEWGWGGRWWTPDRWRSPASGRASSTSSSSSMTPRRPRLRRCQTRTCRCRKEFRIRWIWQPRCRRVRWWMSAGRSWSSGCTRNPCGWSSTPRPYSPCSAKRLPPVKKIHWRQYNLKNNFNMILKDVIERF